MGDISVHFNRSEFACKCGCGKDTIDAETLMVLERLRGYFDKPIVVHSGFRCFKRNKSVGGASNSQHLLGRAADITIMGVDPSEVADYLEQSFPGKYGIGRYQFFTHIDTRSDGPSRWRG